MNIFVYGTLIIPEVMYAVTTREFRSIDAKLIGYARFTVKGESYPGIIPETDTITEGIVYFDVDEWSLKRLDSFEGDLYQRTPVLSEIKGGETFKAEAYVIKPEYRGCLSSKKWDVEEFAQKDLEAFIENYSGFKKTS